MPGSQGIEHTRSLENSCSSPPHPLRNEEEIRPVSLTTNAMPTDRTLSRSVIEILIAPLERLLTQRTRCWQHRHLLRQSPVRSRRKIVAGPPPRKAFTPGNRCDRAAVNSGTVWCWLSGKARRCWRRSLNYWESDLFFTGSLARRSRDRRGRRLGSWARRLKRSPRARCQTAFTSSWRPSSVLPIWLPLALPPWKSPWMRLPSLVRPSQERP
jgi:hypothetical protein